MANPFKVLGQSVKEYGQSIPDALKNATADLLADSDFISRTIGMTNSYEDIMFIVQALGREPISLLGKDYLFIFDHVRRNYSMGTNVMNYEYGCPKFTFYKEKPTVRFADPYYDPMNLLDRWMPDVKFEGTSQRNILFSYAESDDDFTNNKEIPTTYDIDRGNPGVNFGGISSFANTLASCDMIKKTNDNFNHGKYRTLIARFHTNSLDSKDKNDITQTAISEQYGMSHGKNLLKKYSRNQNDNGYDNPYCRVWTYHHQYNQLARAIRPFDLQSAEMLENGEKSGFDTVGFRTVENEEYGFKGGSARLDKYGVLNYKNGLVNIAPTAKISDYFEGKTDKEITIKKCMFSIENLAWRSENIKMNEFDKYGLSPEQKGPLGGRIMWFPPYDLTFSENVNVNWNQNQFIGRGEKVYTYTDTERTGNLSFTLLIDHPSILDYWSGHKRNGMKNGGTALIPGNGGGIDEINNQENTLLRFFSGCEVLTAKPQQYKNMQYKPEVVNDVPTSTIEEVPETDLNDHSPEKKAIHCVLYFPNNYSGIDDYPNNGGSVVNAIYYLMNGVGTQKYVTVNKYAEDIPTSQLIEGQGVGYELKGSGISLITKNLNDDYETIKSTYADLTTKERKAQYLTDENGTIKEAMYGSNFYSLAKMVGDEAMSLGSAQDKKNLLYPYNWYAKRWYYRVDKAYINDKLTHKDSYLDCQNQGLNGNGYIKLTSTPYATDFGINDSDSSGVTLISFADLFVALEGSKAETLLSGQFDKKNVETVKEIINDSERFNITSIKFQGHASSQGRNKSNSTLSRNRALTFQKWMRVKNFPNIDKSSIADTKIQSESVVNEGGANTLSTKLWRSASVIIEYEESGVLNAALSDTTKIEKSKVEKTGEVLAKVEHIEIPNKESSPNSLNNQIPPAKIFPSYEEMESSFRETAQKKMNLRLNELKEEINAPNTPTVEEHIAERYDNEGEFFELLEKNDPFMHHLITEKIRYFDPAFHSISPEGFNARLTFLHQCTRQGSTVGASDSAYSSTAYNLSFGRPPICVLRLGDFYYTKIIINSIDIQYEQPQWDLNPEGIGVMPMFAKVSMRFVFLGGSDLAGPISRLQNAVSFNYYANTGVYDNRAEMVQYDSDGNGKEVKFKPFSYPDMLHNNGIPKKMEEEVKEEKKKGVHDADEDLRWMRQFYKDINVNNAETMQTDERIIDFDSNFDNDATYVINTKDISQYRMPISQPYMSQKPQNNIDKIIK